MLHWKLTSLLLTLCLAMLACTGGGAYRFHAEPRAAPEDVVLHAEWSRQEHAILLSMENRSPLEIVTGYPCSMRIEGGSGDQWLNIYQRDCSRELWGPDLLGPGLAKGWTLYLPPDTNLHVARIRVATDVSSGRFGGRITSNELIP